MSRVRVFVTENISAGARRTSPGPFPQCLCIETQMLCFKSPPPHRRFRNRADEILAANGDAFRPGRFPALTGSGTQPGDIRKR